MAELPAVPRRRRLLVITYYWPPSGGSGVQRWLKFAKFLPERGWDCVVVTPEDADYPVRDESLLAEVGPCTEVIRRPIWEPYAAYRSLTGAAPGEDPTAGGPGGGGLLKRFATWVRANFFVPDPRVYWVKPTAAYLLREYLPNHPVDAVVTTGPPHSVHLVALALKRALPHLPWVMDVRDPWSRFDIHLGFKPGAHARAKSERLERECLAAADRVVGTSPSMPDSLEPFDRGKYVCVTNGYDAADFADTAHSTDAAGGLPPKPDAAAQAKFHVYHTGLLNAVRNPDAVWTALARLCAREAGFAERLHVHLIGNVAAEVTASLAGHPALAGRYTVTPWLPHDELLGRYADADLFLLCPNRSDNARAQINGKLFEYLAARRPILHVGPFDADNTRILDETHAGLTVLPGDVDGVEAAVREVASGSFASNPHALQVDRLERYTRASLAGRLAAVLDTLVPVPTPDSQA